MWYCTSLHFYFVWKLKTYCFSYYIFIEVHSTWHFMQNRLTVTANSKAVLLCMSHQLCVWMENEYNPLTTEWSIDISYMTHQDHAHRYLSELWRNSCPFEAICLQNWQESFGKHCVKLKFQKLLPVHDLLPFNVSEFWAGEKFFSHIYFHPDIKLFLKSIYQYFHWLLYF